MMHCILLPRGVCKFQASRKNSRSPGKNHHRPDHGGGDTSGHSCQNLKSNDYPGYAILFLKVVFRNVDRLLATNWLSLPSNLHHRGKSLKILQDVENRVGDELGIKPLFQMRSWYLFGTGHLSRRPYTEKLTIAKVIISFLRLHCRQ